MHGERSTEQAVTHICYRRKNELGLRKSPGYESKILPIPVASVRINSRYRDCKQRRILGRNWDKSLTSFPPCYSQSPDFTPPPSSLEQNWFETGL